MSIYQLKVDASNIDLRIKNIEKSADIIWSPPLKVQLDILCEKWSNPESDGTGLLFYSIQQNAKVKLLKFFRNPKRR